MFQFFQSYKVIRGLGKRHTAVTVGFVSESSRKTYMFQIITVFSFHRMYMSQNICVRHYMTNINVLFLLIRSQNAFVLMLCFYFTLSQKAFVRFT